MWQGLSYEMSGGGDDTKLNGIPLALVSRVDGGDNMNIGPRVMVEFDPEYNSGTIDAYDAATNGVYITWAGNYDGTWFDADAVMSH